MKKLYYVYLLIDPISYLPFYVGKGIGNRVLCHFSDKSLKLTSSKNSKIKNILSQNLVPLIIYYIVDVSEITAFIVERALILKYGRKDLNTGILCNHTDGGEGLSNISDYTKNKMSIASKNKSYYEKFGNLAENEKLKRRIGGKNKSPKILIYNDSGILQYVCEESFRRFCNKLGLPGTLMNSAKNNGEKIQMNKYCPNKEFKGWFAKFDL